MSKKDFDKGQDRKIDLSSLSNDQSLSGVGETRRGKLQKATIKPIIKFFIYSNLFIAIAIITLTLVERFTPGSTQVITDKVVIAAIGGITIQSGAIIIAAFKGLFSRN